MGKKNAYAKLRERQQKEFDSFPCFFAFSDKQFKEGMESLGVSSEKDLYPGIGGMFYRKADADKLHELMDRLDAEMKEALKDDTFLLAAFKDEMANREYCISHDDDDVIEAIGLSADEVAKDARMSKIFQKARKEYFKAYERSNCVR